MNNKMIKKNLPLFILLGVAAVAALILLIYVVILIFEWNGYWSRTDNARSKISRLVKQNPRPGRENEIRVQHDVEIYKKAAEGLRKQFKSPLQPALDAFFAALQPPLISALSEEEKEQYKVPGTGVEADAEEGIKAVPLKIRKLSQQEFSEFFRNKFEKYCEENGKNETERFSMATLNEFMASSLGFFPKGNWAEAVKVFAKNAGMLTFEPVNDSNQIAVLLSALGFQRRVADDPQLLQRHVDDMIAAIGRNASENKLMFAPQALTFVGGMSGLSGSSSEALPLKDYPMALFHWDVFGDIVSRLGQAKATSLQQVVLRTSAGEEGESENAGRKNAINLENSFEQVGNFRIYHYTVAFTAPMNIVRDVVRTFDQAGKDNRTYVVRSLCLYAKENGAAVVMEQKSSGEVENSSADDEMREEPVRRVRRRRSRRRVDEPELRQEVKKEDDVQAQIAAREAALPVHQRSDYGMIRIGGDAECIVYMDIDYVVLGSNQ